MRQPPPPRELEPEPEPAPPARRAAKVVLAAPFFARPQHDTTVLGLLEEGELLEVLQTMVDDNGRTKVQHARGWSPAFAPDGRQTLLDLGGGAIAGGENTRLPGAGVRYRCVVAGITPRRGLDKLAPMTSIILAQGEVIVALELRAVSGARRCLRCRAGWVDVLGNDDLPQLERVSSPEDGGAVWSDEQERVSQWLALAGHAQQDSKLAPALCELLRAGGVAPEGWVQTLAAEPELLESRIAAAATSIAAASQIDEAALCHAAELLKAGEYSAAGVEFRQLLSQHRTDAELQRGLREAEKGERLLSGMSLQAVLAEISPGGEDHE
jgi:hypothetical protein|eukprot:COSAG02_NODE_6911_length_3293_cov_2.818096_2_plen_325_part_00